MKFDTAFFKLFSMKRQFFTIIILVIFSQALIAQSQLYRHYYRHEFFLTSRIDKDYNDFLHSLGYEFSFNKNKTYLSLSNEFLSPLSIHTNIGNALMSILKFNYQSRYITSLGIGLKQNFKVRQSNFVAMGMYKHDFFKHKLTFSANVLLEAYKPVATPIGTTSTCLSNCPTHFFVWRFGLAVGKYF